MDAAERHVLEAGKSPNGLLGLWLSNVPHMCINFGPYVYETQIDERARVGVVPFSELYGWHRSLIMQSQTEQMEHYKRLRLDLLNELDVFVVEDGQPTLGEVVVVNLDVLSSHRLCDDWMK
jgi:hypothetical protein